MWTSALGWTEEVKVRCAAVQCSAVQWTDRLCGIRDNKTSSNLTEI